MAAINRVNVNVAVFIYEKIEVLFLCELPLYMRCKVSNRFMRLIQPILNTIFFKLTNSRSYVQHYNVYHCCCWGLFFLLISRSKSRISSSNATDRLFDGSIEEIIAGLVFNNSLWCNTFFLNSVESIIPTNFMSAP